MSIQRAQSEISSSEFVDWLVYLDKDMSTVQPIYYYLAQIALEVRRSFVKNPMSLKLKTFLFSFGSRFAKKKSKKMTIEEKARHDKEALGALFNIPKEMRR